LRQERILGIHAAEHVRTSVGFWFRKRPEIWECPGGSSRGRWSWLALLEGLAAAPILANRSKTMRGFHGSESNASIQVIGAASTTLGRPPARLDRVG
jgi:hypothetical protein